MDGNDQPQIQQVSKKNQKENRNMSAMDVDDGDIDENSMKK
jgi:hypothetical protein